MKLQNLWEDRGLTEFRDYLEWYVNLDVELFVTAVMRFKPFTELSIYM